MYLFPLKLMVVVLPAGLAWLVVAKQMDLWKAAPLCAGVIATLCYSARQVAGKPCTKAKLPISVVLIGKTGVGKSQIANLLLNPDGNGLEGPFKVSDGVHACTAKIAREFDGSFNVVDTPGFADTDESKRSKNFHDITTLLYEEGGLVVYVAKACDKLTPEEQNFHSTHLQALTKSMGITPLLLLNYLPMTQRGNSKYVDTTANEWRERMDVHFLDACAFNPDSTKENDPQHIRSVLSWLEKQYHSGHQLQRRQCISLKRSLEANRTDTSGQRNRQKRDLEKELELLQQQKEEVMRNNANALTHQGSLDVKLNGRKALARVLGWAPIVGSVLKSRVPAAVINLGASMKVWMLGKRSRTRSITEFLRLSAPWCYVERRLNSRCYLRLKGC